MSPDNDVLNLYCYFYCLWGRPLSRLDDPVCPQRGNSNCNSRSAISRTGIKINTYIYYSFSIESTCN